MSSWSRTDLSQSGVAGLDALGNGRRIDSEPIIEIDVDRARRCQIGGDIIKLTSAFRAGAARSCRRSKRTRRPRERDKHCTKICKYSWRTAMREGGPNVCYACAHGKIRQRRCKPAMASGFRLPHVHTARLDSHVHPSIPIDVAVHPFPYFPIPALPASSPSRSASASVASAEVAAEATSADSGD